MIKIRNKLRRICQRTNKQEYKNIKNKLSNLIKRKIAIFSNENWNRKLDELEVKDNSLWKMAKCLTKRKETEIPVLHGLNGLAISNEDRVAQIADNIKKVHYLTDNIQNILLKNLPRKVIVHLNYIFNADVQGL